MHKLILAGLAGSLTAGLLSCKQPKERLLDEVLTHYAAPQDSLQRKAARFLVTYMDGLTSGSAPDIKTLQTDYLIQNIDLAFQEASKGLTSGTLAFADFCEYVLPYRLANEPLTHWRQQCLTRYRPLRDTFRTVSDQDIAIGKHINIDYYQGFTYSLKKGLAQYKPWEQLYQEKEGDCWAMTNLITYPLRALGIPVATDFAPKWSNSNGGPHAWNALKAAHHGWIPFMGCERYPVFPSNFDPFIINNERRLAAKVFRQTYSINKEMLPYLVANTADIPAHLFFDRVVDVTEQYLRVSDISIPINSGLKADIVYLAAFSDGTWTPAYWAKPQKTKCVFRKMGRGILYLPCTYSSSAGLTPIGDPFYVDLLTGKLITYKPDFAEKKPMTIAYTQSKAADEIAVYGLGLDITPFYQVMDSVCLDLRRSKPLTNTLYRLYVWNGSWKLIGESVKRTDTPLRFENIPVKGVYRLQQVSSKNTERLFTYVDGKQIWW